MNRIAISVALAVAVATSLGPRLPQAEPGWSPPPESERCPSKWGEGDELGSVNHMTPEQAAKAARLIETGEVFELGHVLRADMPGFGNRRFDVHSKRTFINQAPNTRGSNEEIVITEIGQVGTQLDGFTHQSHGMSLYNCFRIDEIATRGGFTRLGIENVGTIMTRGVLIDVAGLKGVDILPDDYEITAADLQAALASQGVSLEPGDAVLIRTGWSRHWAPNNADYYKVAPGIGIEAAEWLTTQDPMLIGADNWPVEVAPNPDPELSLPVHQIALVVHGVHLLENLKLEALAAAEAWEFAFVMQPLKVKGGSGSTVAPAAIR